MKKCSLTLLTILCLVSCNSTKNQIRVIKDLSKRDTVTSISEETLERYIDSKQSFFLFFLSDSCSSCEDTKKALSEYQKDKHYVFLNYLGEQYETLTNKYKDVFQSEYFTPQFYVFKEGVKVANEIVPSRLKGASLGKIIDSVANNSPFYTLNDVESISSLSKQKCFYFFYDSQLSLTLNVLSNVIYQSFTNLNKKVILIDLSSTTNEVKESLKQTLSLDTLENRAVISNSQTSEVDYSNNIDALKSLINSFEQQ